MHEPKDKDLLINKKWYLYKFNGAGLNYKLGITVFGSKLIWMKGPMPASDHDATAFKSELQGKIPGGKMVIADSVYSACNQVETPRTQKTPEVQEFMHQAQAWHESFNAKLKNFSAWAIAFVMALKTMAVCLKQLL